MYENNYIETLRDVISFVAPTFAGGFAGWIFGRRQKRAEAESVEVANDGIVIENEEKIVKLYQQALDDLEQRNERRFSEFMQSQSDKIKLLNDEIDFLKSSASEKAKLLQDEIRLLKRQNSVLRKENKELKARVKELESK